MSKGEDQIRRAIEAGQFDNLPGKGKPLKLDENPFEDPEWRLANKMLHDGGFTLPWIEARQEIENELKAAREGLARAWDLRKASLTGNQPYASAEAEWQRAEIAFRKKVDFINKQIFNYNLQAPAMQFQLTHINAERELEAIKQ